MTAPEIPTEPTREQSAMLTFEIAKKFDSLYLEADYNKFKVLGSHLMGSTYKLGFENGKIGGEADVMIKLKQLIQDIGPVPDTEKLLDGLLIMIREYNIKMGNRPENGSQ